MLSCRIIPCLDVTDGRVVKGVKFQELRDAGDPVEQAMLYDAAGADELCFLDITASHEKRGILLDVVRRTAEVCFMPLTVGGGVRTEEDVRALLAAGADKVSINTAAVASPDIVRRCSDAWGAQAIVVAIDAKRKEGGDGWEVFIHGGVGTLEHLRAGLVEGRASAVLAASIFHDGTHTVSEAKQFLARAGVPVRPVTEGSRAA